jgi:hypothetical protein
MGWRHYNYFGEIVLRVQTAPSSFKQSGHRSIVVWGRIVTIITIPHIRRCWVRRRDFCKWSICDFKWLKLLIWKSPRWCIS